MIGRASGRLARSGLLLLLFSAIPVAAAVNQAPIANAGPDRTGTVNVAITLNGSGSRDPDGTIVAYWWQLGDGAAPTTSTPSVSHVYTAAGTYNVILWVRDNAGAWSPTGDVAVVTIGGGATTTTTTSRPPTTTTLGNNQAPISDAGPNQASQTLTSLTFNGSGSRDNDGSIAMANWTFGDGASAGGLVVTHSYATAGTYTATLSVLDNRGALDTDTASISIANRAPSANAGPDVSGSMGVAVALSGSGSDVDGTIATYAWVFGDGSSGSGAATSHVYAAAGTYTATLTVTDNRGAQASDSALVTIVNATGATWARKIGSSSSDGGYAIRGDAAGNTVVGGSYRGSVNFGGTTLVAAGGADGFVAKYSPSGGLVWVRGVGGPGDDFVDALTIDASGDVLVAGRFSGTAAFGGAALVSNGPSDMAIAKYSGANGAHQWSKRFGGTFDDAASAVAVDGSNNVYFTGYFRGSVDFGGGTLTVPYTSDLDVFVAKFSASGVYGWAKHFTNNGNERGYGIATDGAGNVAITGCFSNGVNFGGGTLTATNAMTDVFVARFTSAGAHTWSKRFGAGDGSETGYGVAMDSGGNVVITGQAIKPMDLGGGSLSALGGSDAFVAKYAAASGNHLWSRRLGSVNNDYAYGVSVDGANNVFVVGSFEGLAAFGGISLPLLGASDVFVAKYGSTGALVWARGLGGLDSDVGRAIGIAGGNPIVTGYFSGTGLFGSTTLVSAGMADAFVARLAP